MQEGSGFVEDHYWLPDIVAMARLISNEKMIIDRYRHYLESGRQERYRRSKIYGMNEMEKGDVPTWFTHLWYSRKDAQIQGTHSPPSTISLCAFPCVSLSVCVCVAHVI